MAETPGSMPCLRASSRMLWLHNSAGRPANYWVEHVEMTPIDAIVATTAETLGQRVRLLTGDPDDLGALTASMTNVTVVAV